MRCALESASGDRMSRGVIAFGGFNLGRRSVKREQDVHVVPRLENLSNRVFCEVAYLGGESQEPRNVCTTIRTHPTIATRLKRGSTAGNSVVNSIISVSPPIGR